MKVVVIGGGAAGFFGAIALAERHTGAEVLLLERGPQVLQKVKISGGGRCNVTHACFDTRLLTQFYPRGERELYGPFTRFGPKDTIEWFASKGVSLKTESDGRMFPTTDRSQTIIDCLWQSATRAGVHIRTGARVQSFAPLPDGRWQVTGMGEQWTADKLLIATGSSESIWQSLAQLDIPIVSPVPSLFTFNTKDTRLRDLSGISAPEVVVTSGDLQKSVSGPVLITHWGLSGPGILKLSAWGARVFSGLQYKFSIRINWLGGIKTDQAMVSLSELKALHAKKQVKSHSPLGLPLRLWQNLCAAAAIEENTRWADLHKKQLQKLAVELCEATFPINGKSTFKEEFVTAGGVSLKAVSFKTFESKQYPGLYFAGEVLDIDALTGGFNFQAAWTGGWIAGNAIADSLK